MELDQLLVVIFIVAAAIVALWLRLIGLRNGVHDEEPNLNTRGPDPVDESQRGTH